MPEVAARGQKSAEQRWQLQMDVGRTITRVPARPFALGPDELCVRVLATGVCGSDLAVFQGRHPYKRPPIVLGHELSGLVEEVGGQVTGVRVGDRVTALSFRPCGACLRCREDQQHLCSDRVNLSTNALPGSFASHVRLAESMVATLPSVVSDEDGALAEPLAIVHHAFRRAGIGRGDRIVLLGCGALGFCALALAARLGVIVTAVDFGDARADAALAAGAADYFDAASVRAGQADACGAARVLVTGASAGVLTDASAWVLDQGTILLVSFVGEQAVDFNTLVRREVSVLPSSLCSMQELREVVAMIADGSLRTSGIVSHRLPLDRAADGLLLAQDPAAPTRKVMLRAVAGRGAA